MGVKFLNPYHFIPLQKEKSIWEEDSGGTSYTGMLSYEVTARTPLLIPGQILKREKEENDREGEETGHPYKRFFTYDNTDGNLTMEEKYRPSIPGSEIRGSVRSIYETLTNSCLSMIDEEEAIARRVSDRFLPGLIERRINKEGKASYILFPAQKAQASYESVDGLGLKDGSVCKGMVSKGKFLIKDSGAITGYLLKGEKIEDPKLKKAHYTMMYLKTDDGKDSIHLSDLDIKNLERVLTVYGDGRLNKQISGQRPHWYAAYKEELDNFLSGTLKNTAGAKPLFPVYYAVVESVPVDGKTRNIRYLSPACITKEIYSTTVGEIIPGYKPCRSKEGLCPACHLFGMAGDTNEDSMAGKLRFTDLDIPEGTDPEGYYYHDKNYCDSNGMVTLQELSMPKPSAAEFYLQRPKDAKGQLLNWNYDYYVFLDESGRAAHMLSKNGYQPQIMGRKYYWHNLSPQFSVDAAKREDLKTKRNQTVQLVDRGKTFKGRIYFDGISLTELRRLVWICNISSLWEGHGYKIGGGKPIGLGSVEMRVTGISYRELSISKNSGITYCERHEQADTEIPRLFNGIDEKEYYGKGCGFSEEIQPQFQMLTQFLNGENAQEGERFAITYPFAFQTKEKEQTGEKADGYAWFSGNRADAFNGKRDSLVDRDKMKYDQYLDRLEDISKAQLDSMILSEPAAIENGVTEPDIAAPGKEVSEEMESNFISIADIVNKKEFPAIVNGKEIRRGKCIVKFTLKNNEISGDIEVKRSQSENFRKGDEIKLRCEAYRNFKYSFKLAQQEGRQ